ncbi:hypothetical protein [Pseudomonas sp. TH10]|uniref:hypothetical protein n=1 Tax=Pseudomonas sp. TH10 TaxID=2796376 RepID=UPI001911835E|nr:hypothetical protein [Pseudomonas sp. TH10]MBK5516881.1 hypothetical protein [Pseudomonas sp. TH10]
MISTLANIRAHLESEVRSTFDVTEGIGQLVRVDGEISSAHFDGMARQAISSQPHIRHIALAPDDVVRNIFPLEGNRKVLGLDYRKLPEQYRAIERSREQKKRFWLGPCIWFRVAWHSSIVDPFSSATLAAKTLTGAMLQSSQTCFNCSLPAVSLPIKTCNWPFAEKMQQVQAAG